jgi:hypothetical protein
MTRGVHSPVKHGRPIIDDILSFDDLMGQIARMPRSVVYVTLSADASPKTLAIDILNAFGKPSTTNPACLEDSVSGILPSHE